MGPKRFKDQILCQILETCHGKAASKTKIVYESGMNFKTIKPYMAILDENGLIEKIHGSPTQYRITDKGFEVLEHLRALAILIRDYSQSDALLE
jgi:predicted transcriptional regulator